MRASLILCALFILSHAARADEAADLRRVLDLLGTLRMTDDYDAVKRLLPELGPLSPDVGEQATEAKTRAEIAGVELQGEFNFAKGRLISHGYRSGDLSQAKAHALLIQSLGILRSLYGEEMVSVVLPGEDDGPPDTIATQFRWVKDGLRIALDFSFTTKSYRISWGAQAEKQVPEVRRSQPK